MSLDARSVSHSTWWRCIGAVAFGGLALLACVPSTQVTWGEDDEVRAAIRAFPLDSLCPRHCGLVVIDTLIRLHTTVTDVVPVRNPVAATLSRAAKSDWKAKQASVAFGAVTNTRFGRDTATVFMSISAVPSRAVSRSRLQFFLSGGDSWGLTYNVWLRRSGQLWIPDSVRIQEP